MYRKTIARIEQSAHEQLPERDCRCMRVTEKSVHTFSPTLLCHYYMFTNYISDKQLVIKHAVQKSNGLAMRYLLLIS